MASERRAVLLGLSAAAAFAAAAAAAQAPEFDQGVKVRPVLEAARTSAGMSASPDGVEKIPPVADEGAVWISVGADALAHPAEVSLPMGVPVLANGRAAVFKVSADRLPEISGYMHEHFKRCGGFFAHDSRAEAEADLASSAASGGGDYTLDQQAVVTPLMGRVKEAELRQTIEALAAFNNRYYQADTGMQAAQWVAGRWQNVSKGLPGASVALVNHANWKQPSVVLTIPGSERPDEIVVLGGHLDSINGWGSSSARAPGADDNASGIAVLTETVRVLASSGWRPKRTVKVMGYAAEEVGLRGSNDIARQHQGAKVVGVIQYDMTNFKGSGDGIFFLSDHTDQSLTAFEGKLVDAYVGVPWALTECGYACSDHASWEKVGKPASAAFESTFDGMNHALHTENDTLGTSGGSAEHSVAFAKLGVAFAVELAKTASGATLAGAAPKADAGR